MIAADERGARARRSTRCCVERRFGTERVVVEEHLDGEELSLLALCDGERALPLALGPGLQADLRRRSRARTPAAWAPTRRCRRSTTRARARALPRRSTSRCSTSSRARGIAVPRRAVRGADDDRRRAQGARVQRPLRRPRDAGDPAAAAVRPARRCSWPRASPAGSRSGGSSGRPQIGGDRRAGERRLPGVVLERRRDQRPRRASRRDVYVTHAGTARTATGAFVTAGGRVLSVTALGADAARRPRGGLCCRRHDRVRRQAAAPRHRAAGRAGELRGPHAPQRAVAIRRRAPSRAVASSRSSTSTRRRSAIVMGSKSDLPAMETAEQELTERGIRSEMRVMSAHREPDIVADYARNARLRGLRVIIAGAGLSAALPGVVAAHTDLPVIGVPLTQPDVGRRRPRCAAVDRADAARRPGRLRRRRQRAQRRRARGTDPERVARATIAGGSLKR